MAFPHIKIGDNLLQDALLTSVEVVQELNQHWWCSIVCRQTQDQRIPIEDLLGKSVEIKTVDDSGTEHLHKEISRWRHQMGLPYPLKVFFPRCWLVAGGKVC